MFAYGGIDLAVAPKIQVRVTPAPRQAPSGKYENEEGGYSFTTPPGWTAKTSSENSLHAEFGPSQQPDLGSVQIIGHALSLESFIADLTKALPEGMTIENRQDVQVGGLPGIRLRITVEGTESEGVFVARGTIIYGIGVNSVLPEDLTRLTSLLDSFRFSGEPPKILGFPDVASSHPYVQAIAYVQGQGIVAGFPDGTFRPDQPINRAEFTKIFLGTLVDSQTLAACDVSGIGLSDVPADAWFAPFVCVAKELGIIQGYSDGTFRPSQNVNFAEAAKIVVFAILASTGTEVVPGEPWYRPYIESLAALEAIPQTVAAVDAPLTRGEMAEIIARLQLEATGLPSKTYDDLTR